MKATTITALTLALGISSTTAAPAAWTNSTEPCAAISASVAQAVKANSSSLLFDPQAAQDCLLSIPFASERSVRLITELTKHIQFQSTLETLKSPPSSYLSKGVDILGGLSSISDKANKNGYSSQYEFDTAVNDLLSSANEGHLSARMCTNTIFSFSIPYSLVSVSADGIEPPEILSGREALAAASSNGTVPVGSISTINGKNASAFLEEFATLLPSQDPDARYNSLFRSYGRPSSGQQSGFFVNLQRWPGVASVDIQFENGTSTNVSLVASFGGSFKPTAFNFTTGAQVFDFFCLPTTTSGSIEGTPAANSTTSATPSYAPTATAGPLGYPKPVIRSDYNLIAGYYMEDAYNDTAVLFIPNFATNGDAPELDGELPITEIAAFADVAAKFVEDAKAQGKKRMIIDVTGNPGGTTISGFNLYKLFFPEPPIYMANRYRDHDVERLMLKSLSDAELDFSPEILSSDPIARHWSWQGQVAPDGNATNFTSWEDFYGPEKMSDGSSLTSPTNFNNFTAITTPTAPIQGYGEQTTNFTSAPFAGSDIIIMGDGACASTCPIFVNLMKQHGSMDIKTVAFGGRPNGKAMQLMGGTRGSELYTFSQLASDSAFLLEFAVNRTVINHTAVLTQDELTLFNQSLPLPPSEFPLVVASGGVNLRNNYNMDNLELPLHFAYEAADCRLYYSPENLVEPATQWYSAAEAIWGGKGCVAQADSPHDEINGSGSDNNNGNPSGTTNEGGSRPPGTGAAASLPFSRTLCMTALAVSLTFLAL